MSLERNDVCHPELARPNATRRGVPPRPVVDPEGTRWPSLSAAARAYRLTYTGIRYRVVAGTTGWRWAEGRP